VKCASSAGDRSVPPHNYTSSEITVLIFITEVLNLKALLVFIKITKVAVLLSLSSLAPM
jgi:hypothetical protein